MKIAINEPCHENWNAMQPNNEGAFCLSCQKNVIDFSKKSLHEIKNFFSSITQSDNVCGRFKSKQLEELSFDDFFEKFKKWRLPYKLAIILVFTFGFGLFSCQTNTTDAGLVTGEPVVIQNDSTIKVIQQNDSTLQIDGLVERPTGNLNYTLGGPKVCTTNTTTVIRSENNDMLMGEPSIYTPPKDSIKKEQEAMGKIMMKGDVSRIEIDSTIINKPKPKMILGKPARK